MGKSIEQELAELKALIEGVKGVMPEKHKTLNDYRCSCHSNDDGFHMCDECVSNEKRTSFNEAIDACVLAMAKWQRDVEIEMIIEGKLQVIAYNNELEKKIAELEQKIKRIESPLNLICKKESE